MTDFIPIQTISVGQLVAEISVVTPDMRSLSVDCDEEFKLLYLALRNIAKKWTMPIRDWKSALNQFRQHLLTNTSVNNYSD